MPTQPHLVFGNVPVLVYRKACAKWRNQLDISYPVSNGIIQNWDDMCHVWDHAFHDELKIDSMECKILLTDPPLNPSKNREQMVETMFERYNFSGVFIQIQAVLTLYAQGSNEDKSNSYLNEYNLLPDLLIKVHEPP
ncbi:hypothetical protein V2J09_001504 [Rumex salicifolius]